MGMLSVRKFMLFGALTLVLGSFGRTHEDLKTLPLPDVRSPYYLIELANYELLLVNALQHFERDSRQANRPQLPVKIAEALNDYFQSFLDDMLAVQAYSNYNSTGDSGREIAQNPLLSFKMVWRFAFELQAVHSALLEFSDSVPAGPAKTYFSSKEVVSTWPTNKTVDECIVGILRIQMVYDLEEKDLAYGTIMEIDTGVALSNDQLLRIGVFAHETKQYTLAISWLELLIEKLNNEEQALNFIEEIGKRNIQDYLNGVYVDHDRNWDTKQNWEYFYFSRKLHENGNLQKPSDRVLLRKIDRSADLRKKDYFYNECNFWSLCSGENHQTEIEKSELHCWYETNSNPMLLLAPFKIELLSKSPRIIQIYDMINEAMMINLMTLSKPTLARSKVVDVNKAGLTVESKVRTSVEGWIQEGPDGDNSFLGLTRRIESVTGLHVGRSLASEQYLVASYAFGGHYDCHLDGFENAGEFYDKGNRIATIMFYLSNTLKGGFTAFPQAGVAARPIKGSAVFWYNLKKNGERDTDTYHCACPVVLGHKIISTKWIRSYVQFLNKPCGLLKDE